MEDEDLRDLLEGGRGLVEAVSAALVLLNKRMGAGDLRWTILRVVYEFMQVGPLLHARAPTALHGVPGVPQCREHMQPEPAGRVSNPARPAGRSVSAHGHCRLRCFGHSPLPQAAAAEHDMHSARTRACGHGRPPCAAHAATPCPHRRCPFNSPSASFSTQIGRAHV